MHLSICQTTYSILESSELGAILFLNAGDFRVMVLQIANMMTGSGIVTVDSAATSTNLSDLTEHLFVLRLDLLKATEVALH